MEPNLAVGTSGLQWGKLLGPWWTRSMQSEVLGGRAFPGWMSGLWTVASEVTSLGLVLPTALC